VHEAKGQCSKFEEIFDFMQVALWVCIAMSDCQAPGVSPIKYPASKFSPNAADSVEFWVARWGHAGGYVKAMDSVFVLAVRAKYRV
jgi:hypothetical protein